MKTTVYEVRCRVFIEGRIVIEAYHIREPDGTLRTNQLRRLIVWTLNRYSREDGAQFLSMAWKKPFTLLEEIKEDRQMLQTELSVYSPSHHLLKSSPGDLLYGANAIEVSQAVLAELELRKKLKQEIHRLKPQDSTRENNSGQTNIINLAWELDPPESDMPEESNVPKPYMY